MPLCYTSLILLMQRHRDCCNSVQLWSVLKSSAHYNPPPSSTAAREVPLLTWVLIHQYSRVPCFRPERDTGRDGAGLLHLLPVALPQGPGLLQGLQVVVLLNVLVQVLLDVHIFFEFAGADISECASVQVADYAGVGVAGY